MRSRILCLAVSATLLSVASQPSARRLDGSPLSEQQIDSTVLRLMRAAEVTGVGIAILNHGKVAYSKSYGLRDVEHQLPLTADSVMAGASFSKVAFAYLVMRLVDDQVIDLDKPIQHYLPKPLPDYPEYRDLAGDLRYQKITAAMLLSHTAGFPNFRWLSDDHKLTINFEPGSRYAYSGEGIQLLQFVIETLTKRPLRELMQERVFGPLGMSRTSMVSESRFENDYANGYDEYGRSLSHTIRKTAAAAGSMQTTLRDFTRFIQAVVEGNGLRAKTRELMLSPRIQIDSKHQFPTLEGILTDDNKAIRLSYGLGWGLYWTPHGKAFFKEGHEDGYRNYTVAFDKTKDAIVIMTNSSNGEGIFKELLETLQGNPFTPIEWEGYTPYNLLPARQPLPVHVEVTLEANLLDRLVGRYAVSPELVLKVTRSGGHLLLQENNEAPGELWPEGDLRFFSKTADDVVTFELDGRRQVVKLVIHTGGRDIPVKRIE